MTKATIPAEPARITSALFKWEAPDKPLTVLLSLDVVDRMEREILEAFKAVTKRGSEIGGFLLGRSAQPGPRVVTIEQYEAVECEYARGPLYLLSEADRRKFEETQARLKAGGLPIVGYFRSNTRRDVMLDDDDLALAKEYFAGPDQVFLLVKPFAMKPSLGAIFFWENGQIKSDETYLPFAFKRAELERASAKLIVPPGDPSLDIFSAKPAPATSAPAAQRDEKPAPAPESEARREERPPAAPAPPPVAKKEERPAPAAPPPAPVKREDRPVVAAARREEPKETAAPKPPAPPPLKREDRPAAALPFKREERPPIAPGKPEQRPVGPVLVKKEEPAARADKPAVTPVTLRGGAVAAPAPVKEEPKPAKVELAPAPRVEEKPAPLSLPAEPERRSIFASKVLWIGVIVLVLGVGGYVGYQMLQPAGAPTQQAADTLGLKVERNAGQLLLTWNRQASAIQTASRATLSITDGENHEDVDLDLGQLRSGGITYTPATNDVSFRLEVTDVKGLKSLSESMRVLAGRPSPSVPLQQAPLTPQRLTASSPEPASAKPAEAQAAKPGEQTPAPQSPAASEPRVTATPAVTLQPPRPESLASRLSAPPPQLIEPPKIEGAAVPTGAAALPTSTPTGAAPPPPQPPVRQPERAAATPQQPAAQPAPNVRIGGVVQEARLLSRQLPSYPALARQARVSGVVRVEAVIGPDGRVKSARAISGPPLLRQAATDAVLKWLYQPALLNGQPTEVTTQVDLTFAPSR